MLSRENQEERMAGKDHLVIYFNKPRKNNENSDLVLPLFSVNHEKKPMLRTQKINGNKNILPDFNENICPSLTAS